MLHLLKTLVLLLALSGSAGAQDLYSQRLERARHFLTHSVEDTDLRDMLRGIYWPMVASLDSAREPLSIEQRVQIDALCQEQMLPALRHIVLQQDQVMARLFTLEELVALDEFYHNPVGRSALNKLPLIIQLQQPAFQALVEGSMPSILPEVRRIIGR